MRVDDVADWLTSFPELGDLTVGAAEGVIPPDATGAVVVVTFTGGPGEDNERATDTLAVQLMVRGDQGDIRIKGRDLANRIDDAVMGAVGPFPVGRRRCLFASRAGAPPTWVGQDSAQRQSYQCTYLLTVTRTVT